MLIVGEIGIKVCSFDEFARGGFAKGHDLDNPSTALHVLNQRTKVTVAGHEDHDVEHVDHADRIHGKPHIPIRLFLSREIFHELFFSELDPSFFQCVEERFFFRGLCAHHVRKTSQ